MLACGELSEPSSLFAAVAVVCGAGDPSAGFTDLCALRRDGPLCVVSVSAAFCLAWAGGAASFTHGVVGVIGGGAEEEVVGVDAGRVVAGMTDKKTWRDRAVEERPDVPVGELEGVFVGDLEEVTAVGAVACGVAWAVPFPATGGGGGVGVGGYHAIIMTQTEVFGQAGIRGGKKGLASSNSFA